jgi:hypothetical protein
MSDNEQPERIPALSPHYEVAEKDSGIVMRFIGNTPVVGGLDLIGVGPFHLWAAAAFLEFQATKMVAIQERQAMEREAREAKMKGVAIAKPGQFLKP